MDEREKLRHLVRHWKAHNAEHAEVYREWAAVMKDLGEDAISSILLDIAEQTVKLDPAFEDIERRL